MKVVGSDYMLYLQSLGGFLIIIFIFVPIMKWAFTPPSEMIRKKEKRRLKQDLKRLKAK